MSYTPKNIQRMVAQEGVIANGTAYAQAVVRGAAVNKWHERDSLRLDRFNLTGPLLPSSTQGLLIATQAMKDGGIRSGVEQAKLSRQARMRELYDREALRYEAELHAMGVALAKPRD